MKERNEESKSEGSTMSTEGTKSPEYHVSSPKSQNPYYSYSPPPMSEEEFNLYCQKLEDDIDYDTYDPEKEEFED